MKKTSRVWAAGLLALALAFHTAVARAAAIEGLPKAGEPRAPALAKTSEKTLANGLRVIAIERPEFPLLCAEMLIQSGSEADPPRLAGLAHFTASLLTQGTATRTAPQIAREIEALGAKLETEGRWDATSIKLIGLSAQAAPAFAIFADVVCHPAFAAAEIERERRQALDDLRLALEEPGTVAHLAASRIVLGASPYAHSQHGTLASLARLDRGEIIALHRRVFRPDNALLVIAGNLTAADAFELAEKNFGDWKTPALAVSKTPRSADTGKRGAGDSSPSPSSSPSSPSSSPSPTPRAILIDMPAAGQAAVVAACAGIARTSDDYFAGKVANALLGGGYSSRLNQEIRVKRGLSYGATSALETHRSAGLFTASAQTKNEAAAEVARAMQSETGRLAAELAPADYLAGRKFVLTGAFVRDLETNEHYVKRAGEPALYGLPLDSLAHFGKKIEQVSAEKLRDFAKTHLRAEALSFVIVGRAADAAAPLRELFPNLEIIPQRELDLETVALRKTARR